MGDDEALLDVVTSANVACGFHAGDPGTMVRTCAAAAERGVRIGAHVGYRDLAGFGRRALDVAPADVADETLFQLGALAACARPAGAAVAYVKPHGALYHRCAADRAVAEALAGAVRAFDEGLAVLAPPGSALLAAAGAAGLAVAAEGFADRRYAPGGGLVPRGAAGALLEEADALRQAVGLAQGRPVAVGSICVHGDTPGALGLARAVRRALEDAGTVLRAFA